MDSKLIILLLSVFCLSCSNLVTGPASTIKRTIASLNKDSIRPISKNIPSNVKIFASCIIKNKNTYSAVFGYRNLINQDIELSKNITNKIEVSSFSDADGPQYEFLIGEEKDFLTVNGIPFSEKITWILGGSSVSMDSDHKSHCKKTQESIVENFKVRQIKGKKVRLSWESSSEMSQMEFKMEFSSDGINFLKIEEENNRIISSNNKNFSKELTVPIKGKWYFRLTQIDLDGESEHLNTINIKIK